VRAFTPTYIPTKAIQHFGIVKMGVEKCSLNDDNARLITMIIDADLHNIVPNIDALLPYMDAHWREYFGNSRFRGPIDKSYPIGAETSTRPGLPITIGQTLADMQRYALDPHNVGIGILNCTYEVESLHNPDMAAACARAVNEW